jgi:hypothetical protein
MTKAEKLAIIDKAIADLQPLENDDSPEVRGNIAQGIAQLKEARNEANMVQEAPAV